jgi:hypothetical protein
MNLEAAAPLKQWYPFYPAGWRHIPEDSNLHNNINNIRKQTLKQFKLFSQNLKKKKVFQIYG